MSRKVISIDEVRRKKLSEVSTLRNLLEKLMDKVEEQFCKDPEYLNWFVSKYEELIAKLDLYQQIKANEGGSRA